MARIIPPAPGKIKPQQSHQSDPQQPALTSFAMTAYDARRLLE